MRQHRQRVPLTPPTDLHDVVEPVQAEQTPRLLEEEGAPLPAVHAAEAYTHPLVPTVQVPARQVEDFYARLARRPGVREFLSRLANE